MAVYGYARVSRGKQDLERQLKLIKKSYPDIPILTEKFSSMTLERPVWQRLVKKLKRGDKIVFDSVSRLSRSSEEGYEEYKRLYDAGIELEFISQPFVNTSVYRDAAQKQIDMVIDTGDAALDQCVNGIISAVNDLIIEVARRQIPEAFKAAEADRIEHNRNTKQGVQLARQRYDEEELLGLPHQKLRPGRQTGAKIETAKAKEAKEILRQHWDEIGKTLSVNDAMKLAGCSRNSYFKYRKELGDEINRD